MSEQEDVSGEPKEGRVERPVPRELADMWNEYQAAIDLRDKYISSRWHFMGRALKLSALAEKRRNEFWVNLRKLYWNEFVNKIITYDSEREVCWVKEDRKATE